MRIVKTASGTKLLISKKEVDKLGEKFKVEAGYFPSIRPSDFFTWISRRGYRKDRQEGSHQTWVNDSLKDGDPKKNVTIVFHGPEKEIAQGDLKRILKQIGVDLNYVHNKGLPK
jgi:predicted RNA binding protein YcfA (HicA-like mRNA interferase family)